MSVGKPVFLSRLTSLPEIGGREAVYFDSFEPEDVVETLRAGMRDYYDDPLKAQRLKWQANRFRWQNTAKQYWQLYLGESLVSGFTFQMLRSPFTISLISSVT